MKNTIIYLSISLFLSFTLYAGTMDNSIHFLDEDPIVLKLNENDIKILKHMREEEKLARDVYDYFYLKYELPIFDNISNAEQRHMDRVLTVLTNNGIKDPASSEPGVFNNIELQELYDELIAQGDKSIVDALSAGASIEDVDIRDLMKFSEETKNPSILNIFKNLTCGSRNHMRAFISVLKTYDATYSPKYISKNLFNQIINGNHEKCGQRKSNGMGKKKGNASGRGMKRGNGMGKGSRMHGHQF